MGAGSTASPQLQYPLRRLNGSQSKTFATASVQLRKLKSVTALEIMNASRSYSFSLAAVRPVGLATAGAFLGNASCPLAAASTASCKRPKKAVEERSSAFFGDRTLAFGFSALLTPLASLLPVLACAARARSCVSDLRPDNMGLVPPASCYPAQGNQSPEAWSMQVTFSDAGNLQ